MNAFLFALNAIAPILLLFLLGYFLKRIHFFNEYFVNTLNKYVFRIALPMLLFYNVVTIESISDINWQLVLFSIIAILVIFTLGVIFVLLFIKDPRQRGVILQATFRSNFALIGLPLAQAIGGDEATRTISVLIAFAIPLNNVLAVISLTMFQKDEFGKVNIGFMLKSIVKNPLIIGIFIGIIGLVIKQFIPLDINGYPVFVVADDLPFLSKIVIWIKDTASPMALIALGGQFELSVIKSMGKQITMGTLWRIFITPLIVLSAAYLLSRHTATFDGAFPALIALYASPVAVSSVVMAQEMDNDEILAGQLVVWSSIGSILTLFIIIVTLRSLGVL